MAAARKYRDRYGKVRKIGYQVGTGKRHTRGYWSTEKGEDPNWWRKTGAKRTRSRHRGGRKSTTTYHQLVARRTRRRGIVAVMVRAFKQWWR